MGLVLTETMQGHQIPLGLELQMAMSHHVHAGNDTQVLWKSS